MPQWISARHAWAAVCLLALSGCGGGGAQLVPVAGSQTGEAIVASASHDVLNVAPQSASFTETPRSADAFVESVGINTHFHAITTPYVTNFSKVLSALRGLGVRHFRDTLLSDAYDGRIQEIGALGIGGDFVTTYGQSMSDITAYPKQVPGVMEAVEAPNEYALHGGSNWVANISAFERELYRTIHSSSTMSSIPVIGPSMTSYKNYSELGDLSGYLDVGNMHNYFAANNPGTAGGTPFPVGKYGSLPFFIGSARLVSGSKPLMTTETGYGDSPNVANSVTPSVKVRYTMRELLMQWNAFVSRTYIYALVDEADSLGITDINVNPKPVYIGLQNLLQKLSDPGPIVLHPLTYSISTTPSLMHSLLQKRDNSYRFMCWLETRQTDPVVPKEAVTLKFTTKFGTVDQYIWQDNGDVVTVPLPQHADGSVTLTVTDRVSELKLQQ